MSEKKVDPLPDRYEQVIRAYRSRAGASAEPPSRLDAAILAAAAKPTRELPADSPSLRQADRLMDNPMLSRRYSRTRMHVLRWAAALGAVVLTGGLMRNMVPNGAVDEYERSVGVAVTSAPTAQGAEVREKTTALPRDSIAEPSAAAEPVLTPQASATGATATESGALVSEPKPMQQGEIAAAPIGVGRSSSMPSMATAAPPMPASAVSESPKPETPRAESSVPESTPQADISQEAASEVQADVAVAPKRELSFSQADAAPSEVVAAAPASEPAPIESDAIAAKAFPQSASNAQLMREEVSAAPSEATERSHIAKSETREREEVMSDSAAPAPANAAALPESVVAKSMAPSSAANDETAFDTGLATDLGAQITRMLQLKTAGKLRQLDRILEKILRADPNTELPTELHEDARRVQQKIARDSKFSN